MQTTLLTVAIALILALVAALVGPLLVDWGTYRSLFEREASRLTGLNIRVTGDIDARLLPSPRLTLHNVEIGKAGDDNVRAKELNIEFALSPLMRGEWHADDLYLAAPQLTLTLNAAGEVRAPKLAIKFNPDALSVDRLHFDSGTLTLKNATSGTAVTLHQVAFDGRARSLLGPFDGFGSAVNGADYYSVQLAAGRYDETKGLKLHLTVQPSDQPVNLEADGMLKLAGGKPRFDGSLSLQRPAGLARAVGQVSQPWQVRGQVTATAASALMKNFEFHYGSREHGIKLGGVVEFLFGRQPRLKAELGANDLDLDQALGEKQGGSPGLALRRLAGFAAQAFRPTLPIQIGLGVDRVTLGGGVLQNVRGDIVADKGGWNLTSLEFRAPGFTDAKLSGQLTIDRNDNVTFRGPAVIDANDPKALTAWLEGRAPPQNDELRPLHLAGRVTLGSQKIAVENLTAGFASKTIKGHFAYDFAAPGRSSKFVATLNAPELDLDVALGFGEAILAGSTLGRPHEMAITADIGRATIAGIAGHDISVRVKSDADRWQIDKLSVADLGGAAFSAKGGLMLSGPSPQGSIAVDFDAPAMAPMIALLERFAPKTAQALAERASRAAPAKLHAQLTLGGSVPAGEAKLDIDGHLGKVTLALDGQGAVDGKTLRVGNLRLDGKLAADDGKALVALLGLDPLVVADKGPGELTFKASGPARGALQVDTRLTAGGLAASAEGNARLFVDAPSATLRAHVTRANAAPLRGTGGGRAPLPVSFAGRIALSPKDLKLNEVTASIAGTSLRGHLAVTLGALHHVEGEIEADSAGGPSLIAAAIGMPKAAARKDAAWSWAADPFGNGAFGNFAGKVSLRLRSVELLPRLTAREFRATLRLGKNELALEDMAGVVAGGRLSGALSFKDSDDGLTAHGKIALAGVETASLLDASARPPITGTLALSLDMQGTGLSPVALVGSLHGGGTIALRDAELAGLDPHAFDVVTRAVDQGLAVDARRISDVVRRALDSGQLSVGEVRGKIAVNAGQLRLREVTAKSTDAALNLTGDLDLIDGALDAHLVLSGTSEAGGVRPDIYMALKGPLTAPERSIDVSALSGWLTLRAIENQAKRVKELEDARRKREEAERQRQEVLRKQQEAEARKRQEAEAHKRQQDEAARKRREEQAAREQDQQPIAPARNTPPAVAPVPPTGNAPHGSLPQSQMHAAPRPKKQPVAAARKNTHSPPAGPLQLVPPRSRAPSLPAPIMISPWPSPGGGPPPEASVGPQN